MKGHRRSGRASSTSEIDLVLVNDDASAVLQSSDSGKSMVERFRTTYSYLEWRQPKVQPAESFVHNQCEQHDIARAIKALRAQ